MPIIRPILGGLQIFRPQRQLHKQMIAELPPLGLASTEYKKEAIKFLTQWISHFQNIRITLRWYLKNKDTLDSFFNQLASPLIFLSFNFHLFRLIYFSLQSWTGSLDSSTTISKRRGEKEKLQLSCRLAWCFTCPSECRAIVSLVL